jgi:hypothetical protein
MSNLYDDKGWCLNTTVDDLPLTTEQKEMVLEWYARKIVVIYMQITKDYVCSKSYDPLIIEGNIAHSYAFDLEDGGRRHPFRDLQHLEGMLTTEVVNMINEALEV